MRKELTNFIKRTNGYYYVKIGFKILTTIYENRPIERRYT